MSPNSGWGQGDSVTAVSRKGVTLTGLITNVITVAYVSLEVPSLVPHTQGLNLLYIKDRVLYILGLS